jgi:hypothetical protein
LNRYSETHSNYRIGGTPFGFDIREWIKQKNFNYRDRRVWNGFSWHKTVASVISFERANVPSGFVKVDNILINLVSHFFKFHMTVHLES